MHIYFSLLYIVIQMGSGYDDDHDNDSKSSKKTFSFF